MRYTSGIVRKIWVDKESFPSVKWVYSTRRRQCRHRQGNKSFLPSLSWARRRNHLPEKTTFSFFDDQFSSAQLQREIEGLREDTFPIEVKVKIRRRTRLSAQVLGDLRGLSMDCMKPILKFIKKPTLVYMCYMCVCVHIYWRIFAHSNRRNGRLIIFM